VLDLIELSFSVPYFPAHTGIALCVSAHDKHNLLQQRRVIQRKRQYPDACQFTPVEANRLFPSACPGDQSVLNERGKSRERDEWLSPVGKESPRQVSGAVAIGANTHFEGINLGQTSITMVNLSSISEGLMALAAVNLEATTVFQSTP
jgi:hypothetical protein